MINEKEILFKAYLRNPLNELLPQRIRSIQESIITQLENSKKVYYDKLSHKLISNRKISC